MKKVIRLALVYCVVGLLAGVFYREFTKALGYEGETTLSVLHTHTLVLGMFFMLIVLLVMKQWDIEAYGSFKWFMRLYQVGLPLTLLMLLLRGIFQAQELVLSSGANGAISGIAGIGHGLLGVSMVLFLVAVKKGVDEAVS